MPPSNCSGNIVLVIIFSRFHQILTDYKTTRATDFKFGTRLCMGNAEQAHK